MTDQRVLSQALKKSPKRRRGSWFNSVGPTTKKGPWSITKIDVCEKRRQSSGEGRLVVSVPRACGNAVRRNRIRRIVKGLVTIERRGRQDCSSVNLWLRLSSRFKLPKRILSEEVGAVLKPLLRDQLC